MWGITKVILLSIPVGTLICLGFVSKEAIVLILQLGLILEVVMAGVLGLLSTIIKKI